MLQIEGLLDMSSLELYEYLIINGIFYKYLFLAGFSLFTSAIGIFQPQIISLMALPVDFFNYIMVKSDKTRRKKIANDTYILNFNHIFMFGNLLVLLFAINHHKPQNESFFSVGWQDPVKIMSTYFVMNAGGIL